MFSSRNPYLNRIAYISAWINCPKYFFMTQIVSRIKLCEALLQLTKISMLKIPDTTMLISFTASLNRKLYSLKYLPNNSQLITCIWYVGFSNEVKVSVILLSNIFPDTFPHLQLPFVSFLWQHKRSNPVHIIKNS